MQNDCHASRALMPRSFQGCRCVSRFGSYKLDIFDISRYYFRVLLIGTPSISLYQCYCGLTPLKPPPDFTRHFSAQLHMPRSTRQYRPFHAGFDRFASRSRWHARTGQYWLTPVCCRRHTYRQLRLQPTTMRWRATNFNMRRRCTQFHKEF